MVPMQPQKIKAFFDDFLPVFASKIGVDRGEMQRQVDTATNSSFPMLLRKQTLVESASLFKLQILVVSFGNLNFGL